MVGRKRFANSKVKCSSTSASQTQTRSTGANGKSHVARICQGSSFGDQRYNLTMSEKKVMGPASYFPSIEKKYGKPIDFWLNELKKVKNLAHMEQVAHLKENFEMGHGHANALVAFFRKENNL